MNKTLFGKANRTVEFLARTGVMLALTIVFQYLLGLTKIQLLVGSFVNFFLFFSVLATGLVGAAIVGLCTPFIAFFIGIAGNILLVPFIAIANIILVVVYALLLKLFKVDFDKSIKEWKNDLFAALSFVVAAVVKFLFMYFIALKLILPLVLEKVGPQVAVAFGITQLFTALIGGFVAFIIAFPIAKSKTI